MGWPKMDWPKSAMTEGGRGRGRGRGGEGREEGDKGGGREGERGERERDSRSFCLSEGG